MRASGYMWFVVLFVAIVIAFAMYGLFVREGAVVLGADDEPVLAVRTFSLRWREGSFASRLTVVETPEGWLVLTRDARGVGAYVPDPKKEWLR